MRTQRSPLLLIGLGLLFCLCRAVPAAAIDAQGLFERSKDSVVMILGLDAKGQANKFGSGFYIRQGDLVATNYHVVENAAQLKVKHKDGTLSNVAEIKASNKECDLAVLRVTKPGKALPLAQDDPKVGEEILAIGAPKGLELTISTGIVSGVRASGKIKVYQITAPISPGSSGGPILNAQGEAIGLATFYLQGGQNLNFAVPARYVEDILSGAPVSVGKSGDTPQTPLKTTLEIEKERDGSISIKKKN